jgi:hypothetical protein
LEPIPPAIKKLCGRDPGGFACANWHMKLKLRHAAYVHALRASGYNPYGGEQHCFSVLCGEFEFPSCFCSLTWLQLSGSRAKIIHWKNACKRTKCELLTNLSQSCCFYFYSSFCLYYHVPHTWMSLSLVRACSLPPLFFFSHLSFIFYNLECCVSVFSFTILNAVYLNLHCHTHCVTSLPTYSITAPLL